MNKKRTGFFFISNAIVLVLIHILLHAPFVKASFADMKKHNGGTTCTLTVKKLETAKGILVTAIKINQAETGNSTYKQRYIPTCILNKTALRSVIQRTYAFFNKAAPLYPVPIHIIFRCILI